jgi:hypothetical protein
MYTRLGVVDRVRQNDGEEKGDAGMVELIAEIESTKSFRFDDECVA